MSTRVYKPQDNVDQIIKQFWKSGYLTISRKYGKYLPAPKPVGNFEVDAIGKKQKKIVIGLTLTESEIQNDNIISKIEYLATRKSKYSRTKVSLFVGVPAEFVNHVREIVKTLSTDIYKSIKIIPLMLKNK